MTASSPAPRGRTLGWPPAPAPREIPIVVMERA